MAQIDNYVDINQNGQALIDVGKAIIKPSTSQSLVAATAINPNATAIAISSTAAITLTSTPSITAGSKGQLLSIFNAGSYTITLQDEAQLANTTLKLFNKTIPISAGTHLLLEYRSSKWRQISWGNIIANLAGYAISLSTAPTNGQAPVYDSTLDMLVWTTVQAQASYSAIKYILIEDKKTQGTMGGSPTSGAFRNRDLNNIVIDESGAISLSSNQITLPAGNYWIRAAGIIRDLDYSALRLTSTDALITLDGLNCRAVLTSNMYSALIGKLALSGTKTFNLQQYVTTSSSDSLGYALNQSGRSEYYAHIEIIQYSSSPPYEFALLRDVKAQNTGGGTGAAGGWRLRTLTEATENGITGLSLNTSTSQFTLPAGTFWIRAICSTRSSELTALRVKSTDGTITLDSLNGKCNQDVTTPTFFLARVSLGASTTFELQQYMEAGNTNNFGGIVNVSGRSEVYTLLEITRVADTTNRKKSLIRDIKSQGTGGGTGTNGGWRVRDLNELTVNDIGLSISSNQVTIPSGNYIVRIYVASRELQGNAIRLKSTDSTVTLDGLTSKSHYEGIFPDILFGYLSLSSSKTFEIQEYVTASGFTNNFGLALNQSGRSECYLMMEVEKL